MNIPKTLLIAAFTLCAGILSARAETELGDVALRQALLDVGTDLRLMCVAAHPDDEDSATLAMYRKKWGYKTFAVIATRGEGGQNEIGPELYEELGVLRTHEMRRASEITGADLHFLDLPEFGYSKTSEETLAVWGHDECLRRLVRKIRETKPDVVISHHDTSRGHGHHQVVGIALLDAFDAAADPNRFPEQIAEGLEPWQVARLYIRPFGGGGRGIGEPVVNDTSELDPLRGLSYSEIAGQALREHESQGMGFFVGRFASPRSSTTYYLQKEAPGGTQGGGAVDAPGGGLFAGLKDRVTPAARKVSESALDTAGAKSAALALLKEASDPNAAARANRLAATAMELKLRTAVSDTEVIPGQRIEFTADIFDYGQIDAASVTFSLEQSEWVNGNLPEPVTLDMRKERNVATKLTLAAPGDLEPTIPHPKHLFKPHFLAPQYAVVAKVQAAGAEIALRAPIYVDVAPPVSLEFKDAPFLIQAGKQDKAEFGLVVTNHAPNPSEVTLALTPAKGMTFGEQRVDIALNAEGAQMIVPVNATISTTLPPGDYPLAAWIDGTQERAESIARVVDVVVPKDILVGVVQSYDDTFMKTLARLGVPHEALALGDYTPRNLDRFSTIIIDIRAYLVRKDLVSNNQALLDYVKRGGTVIVNYHKTFEWQPEFGPYPLEISRNRVTVEEAPIKLLVPDHPLFNTPNKIADSDWDGWIQERGLYFPSRWDPAYTPLIETADPGENPPPGSCLIAKYGEGTYMYTALGWYRQLRELHPGTIRIFANMLAL